MDPPDSSVVGRLSGRSTDGWSGRGCITLHRFRLAGQISSASYSNVLSLSSVIYTRLKLNLDAHNKSYSITLCRNDRLVCSVHVQPPVCLQSVWW